MKVLTVDVKKRRVILTHKKSLVNTQQSVITDYNDCSPGIIAEGFVYRIRDSGIMVVFYGNVKVCFWYCTL